MFFRVFHLKTCFFTLENLFFHSFENPALAAIRDVFAHDLRGALTETTGLFAHVLPQAVLARPRAGITPDITAPTRVGRPAQAAGAPPQPPRYTMMDVKTLSGANELTTSCTTRDRTRGSASAGRRCRSGRGG